MVEAEVEDATIMVEDVDVADNNRGSVLPGEAIAILTAIAPIPVRYVRHQEPTTTPKQHLPIF